MCGGCQLWYVHKIHETRIYIKKEKYKLKES